MAWMFVTVACFLLALLLAAVHAVRLLVLASSRRKTKRSKGTFCRPEGRKTALSGEVDSGPGPDGGTSPATPLARKLEPVMAKARSEVGDHSHFRM